MSLGSKTYSLAFPTMSIGSILNRKRVSKMKKKKATQNAGKEK